MHEKWQERETDGSALHFGFAGLWASRGAKDRSKGIDGGEAWVYQKVDSGECSAGEPIYYLPWAFISFCVRPWNQASLP